MLIRAVALQAYEVAALAIGVDPFEQMREVGLEVSSPIDGEAFVPYAPFVRLLERTAEITDCPDFGLRMAQWPEKYFEGPLVMLVQHAETLQHADLRGCEFADLTGAGSLRGAAIDADQLALLAPLFASELGIAIIEP